MKQIRIPSGGLNLDDSPELLPKEDYSYAKNINFGRTVSGENGSIENIRGTHTLTPLAGVPSLDANSTAIGKFVDEEDDASYVFVHNTDSAKHSIVKVSGVFGESDSITPVIVSSFLNFQLTNRITGVAKVGNLLYFTDNYNEPRLIDVTRYTSVAPTTEEEINLIKRPPLLPPPFVRLQYDANSDPISNRGFDNDDFQFAYQYVYTDGQESVLSPFSKLAMRNVDDEDYKRIRIYLPFASTDVQWDSGVDYTVWSTSTAYVVDDIIREGATNKYYICTTDHTSSAGSFSADLSAGYWRGYDEHYDEDTTDQNELLPNYVDYINVCVRRGNYGSWKIVERVEVTTNKAYKNWVDFYNSTSGLIVRTNRTQAYDAVPRKAEALELIKNRVIPGNILEGYDTPSVALSAGQSSVSAGDGVVYLAPKVIKVHYYDNIADYQHTEYEYLYDEVEPTVNNPATYSKLLYFVNYNGNWIRLGDAIGTDPVFDGGILVPYDGYDGGGLANSFNEQFANEAYDGFGDYKEYSSYTPDHIPGVVPVQIDQTSFTESDFSKTRTFPDRSAYKIGMVFSDGSGRKSGVATNADCEVIFRDEEYHIGNSITWSATNAVIPTWATHYGIVITKNLSKTWFSEGLTSRVRYSRLGADGERDYYDTASNDRQNISVNIRGYVESGNGYDFTDGDRIIIYDLAGSGNSYDLAIKEQDGYWLHCEYENAGALTATVPYDLDRFEIYTPVKSNVDDTFYETGDWYPISNPGETYASLSVTSGEIEGDVVVDSIKVLAFDGSDEMVYNSYKYRKAIADDTDDDDVFIWNANLGHAFTEDFIGERRLGNYFRWSGTIIEDSSINGLSEFEGASLDKVDSNNGDIRKLVSASKSQSEGSILLAISEAASATIYINERPLSLSDGTDFITATEQIVGQINTLKERYGTLNPESVINRNGDVYWYDQRNRVMARYGTHSGLFPVSEYKVASYFDEQAGLNDSTYVQAGYDPYYKTILMTFENASSSDKHTIGYNVYRNRFVSFFEFQPECYFNTSDNLYTMIDGTVYIHNNPSTNYIYTEFKDSAVEFSMNDDITIPKEWITVRIGVGENLVTYTGSDGFQKITSGTLSVEISNRKSQATDLTYSDFEVDEGVVYADILKDSTTAVVNPYINGDDIVSETVQVKVLFGGWNQESRIYYAEAGYLSGRGHEL